MRHQWLELPSEPFEEGEYGTRLQESPGWLRSFVVTVCDWYGSGPQRKRARTEAVGGGLNKVSRQPID